MKAFQIFTLYKKHLEKFIPAYNDVRPHCSLKGLTPSEVLAGLRPDNIEHLKSVKSEERIKHIILLNRRSNVLYVLNNELDVL